MVCTDAMNSVNKRINTVCRSAGLPEVGMHGLRHSFASLAYHVGVGELETMRLGGWSDPNTMRRIYRHLSEKDKDAAAQKIAAFFG
jgi:integrase